MVKLTQFVTFETELLLVTATTSATIMFLSAYFNSVLKIPPLVFMFTGAVSFMAIVTLIAQMNVLSIHKPGVGVGDTVLSEVCQGFAVISSILWVSLIFFMFVDVPRITSIPDYEPTASIVSVGVVVGFSFLIPLLALVVSYTALPEDGNNSFVFNGSSVGAFSLLFFVLVSFGSGGVTKCKPFESAASSTWFIICVLSYFGLLYGVEVVNHYTQNPLKKMVTSNTDLNKLPPMTPDETHTTSFLGRIQFNFWRIPGVALNSCIILSTIIFSSSAVHSTVVIIFFVVLCLHVPLILKIGPVGNVGKDPIQFNVNDGEYSMVPTVYPAGENVLSEGVAYNADNTVFPSSYEGGGQAPYRDGVEEPSSYEFEPQYQGQYQTQYTAEPQMPYQAGPQSQHQDEQMTQNQNGTQLPYQYQTQPSYQAEMQGQFAMQGGISDGNVSQQQVSSVFGKNRPYGGSLSMRLNTGMNNNKIYNNGIKHTTVPSTSRQRRSA